ncbi:uncharacterized protein F5Z01DRAFT_486861 [Emericellopsis atlantica]|uniref:Extracellular membrane protein CFEM domain-containing protein n=1 Tax=Emericellopsis atlantica TaxID=2614577 RepID=A0A9P8CS23_9HYPO|nr:uncharacterized protein F5Z01DRAFT_486861 [Emericellopsis atlantica]KAG9256740.1 hypothetical protein F5Z01DRAFT_486861 [Emericellopsis atlantica]
MARLSGVAVVALLGLCTSVLGEVKPNFEFYPKDAQSCLYEASDKASCPTSSNKAQNACFCYNEYDFIINTAKCMGNDDADLLSETYDTMSQACGDSGTPIGLSEAAWKNAAAEGSSTSSAATTEATATSTNESAATTTTGTEAATTANESAAATTTTEEDNGAGSQDGLSTGATIGIAVGCAVVGAALMGAIGFWLFRRYRRRDDPASATPMLPQHDFAGGEGTSAYPASPYNDYTYKSPSSASYMSPANGMEESSRWGTPTAPSELPPQSDVGMTVEMEGSAVPPVEMMGSVPEKSR